MNASVLQIIYLILPIVVAGTFNMIFVKSRFLDVLKIPIDGHKEYKDGKRLFGDNKTWKGFVGMIVLTSVTLQLFEFLATVSSQAQELSLLPFGTFNALGWGAVWGAAYVLSELPNSFIKRRIDIAPGTNGNGPMGYFFLVLDQADSVIGCALAMLLFYSPTAVELFATIVAGTLIHYLTNVVLYFAKLKKQMG